MNKLQFIENYTFPKGVITRFVKETKESYEKTLNENEIWLCSEALKDFFAATLSTNKPLGMPSVLADELWHSFILFTKEYAEFCTSIGRFIHHTPEPDITSHSIAEMKIIESSNISASNNTFNICCEREGINPGETKLPLLFSIDALLLPKYRHKHH